MSNSFLLGSHHSPTSSGLEGTNLKLLHLQALHGFVLLDKLWFSKRSPQKHFAPGPTRVQSSVDDGTLHVM